MALMPKRVKYGRSSGACGAGRRRGELRRVGDSAPALEGTWVSGADRGRVAAQHFSARASCPDLPDKPISKKPARRGWAREGRWVLGGPGQAGDDDVRDRGVPEAVAKLAMVRAGDKMPVRCRMVGRRVRV